MTRQGVKKTSLVLPAATMVLLKKQAIDADCSVNKLLARAVKGMLLMAPDKILSEPIPVPEAEQANGAGSHEEPRS